MSNNGGPPADPSSTNPLQNLFAALSAASPNLQAQGTAQQLAAALALGQPPSGQLLNASGVPQSFQPILDERGTGSAPQPVPQTHPAAQPHNVQASVPFWPAGGFPALPQTFASFGLLGMIQQLAASGNLTPSTPTSADAQRFATPILPSDGYDAAVAERLRRAESEGQSAKDALYGMHGIYNHSANLWIDYYLERKKTIDKLVDVSPRLAKKSSGVSVKSEAGVPNTVKRPSFVSVKTEPTSAPPIFKREKRNNVAASVPGPSKPSRPARTTANSLSSHFFNSPEVEKRASLPTPPSREPSPPKEIVRSATGRGNAFTVADNEYLVNYVSWAVSRNPDLTKKKIVRDMARKAPHHSEGSWSSKWNNTPIIEDIFQNPIRPNNIDEKSSESEEEQEEPPLPPPRAPKRRRVTEPSVKRSVPIEDVEAMAEWVSDHYSDWKMMSDKMRWKPFTEDHPKRTHLEWAEAYERCKSDVVARAKELRRQKV